MEPKDYNKEIKLKLDKTLGYLYFIDKEHPLSYSVGKVFYHRHIMSIKVNRWVEKEEHVHHMDENKTNNDPNNLEILSSSEHMTKHQAERGYILKHEVNCIICGKLFETYNSRYCSNKCSTFSKRKFEISKEELEKLVWELPTTKIAEKFGVSDNAIGKRCKKLNINKPARGYWEKVYHKSCQED